MFMILEKLVEDYKDDVCFMVDSDKAYIQAVKPRIIDAEYAQGKRPSS